MGLLITSSTRAKYPYLKHKFCSNKHQQTMHSNECRRRQTAPVWEATEDDDHCIALRFDRRIAGSALERIPAGSDYRRRTAARLIDRHRAWRTRRVACGRHA